MGGQSWDVERRARTKKVKKGDFSWGLFLGLFIRMDPGNSDPDEQAGCPGHEKVCLTYDPLF